ncbi:MAG: hypothetical protein P4L41_00150, partial [Flavipsychrobacter sp.]|nr:hypothetical protein [Flavipsychrobacter sp.]
TLALRDSSAGCAFGGTLTCSNLSVSGTSIALTNGSSPTLISNSGNAILAGYANVSGNFFPDTIAGDMIYRNTAGSLRFGTSSGQSQMQITSSGVGVNGDFIVGQFTHNISTSVVAPTSTTSSNCITFIQMASPNGGYAIDMSTCVSDSSFSDSAIYNIPMQFGITPSASWLTLIPTKSSPSFGAYRIDINTPGAGGTNNLRLVRVNYTNPGTIMISLKITGSVTYSLMSTISTDTTIPAVYDDGRPGKLYSSIIPQTSAISLPLSTYTNITSLTLPPGNWLVTGNSYIASSAYFYMCMSWFNNVSATLPDYVYTSFPSLTTNYLTIYSSCVPQRIFTLTSTTTIYLSCVVNGNTGSPVCCGAMYATRM